MWLGWLRRWLGRWLRWRLGRLRWRFRAWLGRIGRIGDWHKPVVELHPPGAEPDWVDVDRQQAEAEAEADSEAEASACS